MSFTVRVKEELLSLKRFEKSELAAIIKMSGSLGISMGGLTLSVTTENAKIARHIYELLHHFYEAKSDIRHHQKTNLKKNRVYTVFLDEKVEEILADLHLADAFFGIETGIDASVLEDEVASRAYLRGAFLSSGSIKDPEKGKYQLEIHSVYTDHAEGIALLMQGFLLDAKTIERKKGVVTYLQRAEDIIDFLIVMGGPQSPDEDRQTFPYYDPNAEIAFMQKAIAADIYIVGVCLGAQLLSVAYGGKYEHSPEREIGVFPITLTDDGLADEHVKGFGTTLNTGHWHGDMPGVTDNAVVLATSQGCPRQIIRFSPKHYAFQAHLEFDPEAVELLIATDGEEVLEEQSKNLTYVQKPEAIRAYDYQEMNAKLYAFLDSLTN